MKKSISKKTKEIIEKELDEMNHIQVVRIDLKAIKGINSERETMTIR
jgi:hypothetical protein